MNIEVRMEKPATIQADLANLPAVFWPYQDLPIWTTWSWVYVNGRWTKPPFQPNGAHAKSQGPETWCTYADALDAVSNGKADGIGIMLHGMKSLEIAIDIDHCRDKATGEISDWAQEVINEAASYTEVTPSGTGVRIIGHGDIGGIHRRFNKVDGGEGGLEVYTAGQSRYITITGLQVAGCWPVLSDIGKISAKLVENKGRLEPEQPDLTAAATKAAEPVPAYEPKPGSLASMLNLRPSPADELDALIRYGVPEGQRSEQFHHAVGLAKRLGWTPETLLQAFRANPNGIAAKYLRPDRLNAEVSRCWGKVEGPVVTAADWSAPIAPIGAPISEEAMQAMATVAISSPWDEPAEAIPPREWIIRGLMIRRHISILVAPGGSGKSLLSAQWAIALALGMPWGGWTPVKAEKVMLINAEDDGDEMRRRIHSACKIMGVNPRHLIGRLFLADDPRSIVVAKSNKDKVVVATPLADAIVRTIQEQGIGVVVVDPFPETFEGDENSNSEVKWAAAIWRGVARQCSCSVMLVHHTPKYAKGMAGDADAARGAGALVNSARIVSTLFTMTDEEAKLFLIKPEDSHKYVRFDDAKANLTLITGKAKWFEKISHELPNGDSVGVLKPWKPPGVFDGVSIDTINDILRTLDAGRDGGKYLYNVKAGPDATPAWGGSVIMEATGCDRPRAAKMIGEWIQSGLLLTTEYTSDNRKTKMGLRVDFSKKPGEQ